MAKLGKKRGKGGAPQEAQHRPQARQVFLLDELGRFVAGSTREGVAITEGMVGRAPLKLARELVASRDIPPGTFGGKVEGDAAATVFAGLDLFGCAAQDASKDRDVPHELAAVVTAFEEVARKDLEAGGLSRATLEALARVAVQAIAAPERFAQAPVAPLAFARASFRASGSRLALDLEVVNDTPWTAERVELRVVHDARALPLVSVKAKSGGFGDGVLELPAIPGRSRDRAVLLFEPRKPGLHVVEGELTLGLEGGRTRRGRMRRARTTVGAARVVPTVPRTLREFGGLVEGRLKFAAPVLLPEWLGGLATVAGLATEIEKDALAKVLDRFGEGGAREVWYLGLEGGPDRPLLVQLMQGVERRAEVVVAAATLGDLVAYSAMLRARLDAGYGGASPEAERVEADLAPEGSEAPLRAAMVARQISADIATGEFDTRITRPKAMAASGIAQVLGTRGGRSAGDELVPGLLDALDRAMRPGRPR